MNHRKSPALARNKKTNTLQQPMFIRGHTVAIDSNTVEHCGTLYTT
jgi:hypothetical protein